ncbi:transmembrane protein 68 isoform X2 [Frankliniella occidentalis]|uniref:Transmembrane protein 68 isoform X2 n=1 Tax=Frankliniella occidentalis TaxID=133901 RepID=A0A6J1ST47_FRAOC|nr:transmembrane protein 68 isoform X2 [Frankliniella occidentalis]
MISFISDMVVSIENVIVQYIDIDFTLWLTWALAPVIITFLLPVVIVLLLYLTSIMLYIYRWHRHRLRDVVGFWDGARKLVAIVWDAHGWIWHGYEVCGLENIPDDSPALVIYYHGAVPVDVYYFLSKVMLFKNRMVHTVADRFLFKIPGFSIIAEALKVIPGTVQTCSAVLRDNNLLAISPGGVYEAQFGNSYYHLQWKGRLGFAKAALDAKAMIIPMFTQNIRESFRTVGFGRMVWLKIYQWTRLPIVPIYGGFPVKLKTHVGKPIPYDSALTPEELSLKVASAVEDLIAKHQRIPGSLLRALVERVYEIPKDKLV